MKQLGLDPAKVAGKIVVCYRGVNARTEKSAAVKADGGVGMILTNVSPNSLDSDLHVVPTVHVDEVAGAAIKTYAATSAASLPSTSLAGMKTGLFFGRRAGWRICAWTTPRTVSRPKPSLSARRKA